MILEEFDENEKAMINPADFAQKIFFIFSTQRIILIPKSGINGALETITDLWKKIKLHS